MQTVKLQTQSITDWKTFHQEFKQRMGFPEFYGMNMDAWIDCMSYLDDPKAGMAHLRLERNELLIIEIPEAAELKQRVPEIFDTLIECTTIVNQRYNDTGSQPIISLLLY